MNLKQNKGGVLVFLLVVILALCMLMAYVIDLNSYYVRKTQADANAKIIALTALEEYYDSVRDCGTGGISCTVEFRLERALARASEVANTNLMMADEALTDIERENDMVGAVLEHGIWEREEAKCRSFLNVEAPCFIKLEPGSVTDTGQPRHPNAFRVWGRLFPEGSKNFFADTFLDTGAVGIRVDATASMVPRKGCFLVDISRSTKETTHKNFDLPVFDSEGNFKWNESYQCSNPPAGTEQCCPPQSPHGNHGFEAAEFAYDIRPAPGPGEPTELGPKTPIEKAWACMEQSPNRFRGLDRSHYRHYRNDYRAFTLLTDRNDLPGDVGAYHPPLVADGYEHYVSKSDSYWVDIVARPEPLKTILDGIYSAIDVFQERAVAGDDICLVLFDSNLDWPRVIQLTNLNEPPEKKLDYLKSLTDFSNEREYDYTFAHGGGYLNTGGDTGFERVVKHGMFPSYHSDTNFQQAIMYATKEFDKAGNTSNGGVPSSNFMVLITDGLGNCRECTPELEAQFLCDRDVSFYHCGRDYADHAVAMQDIKSLAVSHLQTTKTPLHVILVGEDVEPHTMDIFNPSPNPAGSDRCYTDEEWRAKDRLEEQDEDVFDFTAQIPPEQRAEAFKNRSSSTPYYQVARDMYEVAVSTGGIFGPLRPKCSEVDPALQPPPRCNSTVGPRKVTCDKENRTKAEQIREYLEKIVTFNPYTIVDVK